MRPIILVSPDDAFEPDVCRPLFMVKRSYTTAVSGAGGLAVMPVEPKQCLDYAEIADGLLLTDDVQSINPGQFGELFDKDAYPTPAWYHNFSHTRDSLDLALCRAFLEKKKPILGIGRGMHILNIALGGTLHQGIDAPFPGHSAQTEHTIHTTPGSVLSSLLGESFTVNNYHRQAVKDLGSGLVAAAHAEDGLIEAIWHEELPVFGVEWNPETYQTEDEQTRAQYLQDPPCENAAELSRYYAQLFSETHKAMVPMPEHRVDKDIVLPTDNAILNYFVKTCGRRDAK